MNNLIEFTFYGCTITAVILSICNIWSIAAKNCQKWLSLTCVFISIIGFAVGLYKIGYTSVYNTCKTISLILAISNAVILLISITVDLLHNPKSRKTPKKLAKVIRKIPRNLVKFAKKIWHIFVILSILNPIGIIGKLVLIKKIHKVLTNPIKKATKWT